MPALHGTALWLDINFWELVTNSGPVAYTVMTILALFSLFSWTVIFSKWATLRSARSSNAKFLRMFRKSPRLDTVAAATEQFRASPLAGVFEFGYSEVNRQITTRGKIVNPVALERTLQIGISEEVSRLERNTNWLATTAAVCPFIGLFGTVLGIIDAFNQIGLAGNTSMRSVGPGIANALIATALGLFAAIPAAVFYNMFGNTIREIGARMEDFSLEFLNLTERNFEE
ncbi:MAG TPA: MotA/TolQ/ExbB proton channel family protein [Bryobacteraceae bacterium]